MLGWSLLLGSCLFVLGCRDDTTRPFSHDDLSGKIVFGTGNELEVLEASSTDRFPKELLGGYARAHPTWDLADERILFCQWSVPHHTGRRLYSIDLKGKNLAHVVGRSADAYDYPSVSPDGKTLAFLMHPGKYAVGWERAPTGKLMVMDMQKEEPYLVFPTVISSSRPSWSPDSKKLMFASVDGLVMILEVKTGRLDTLWEGTLPSWSPDGGWVAYYNEGQVFVRNLKTEQAKLAAPRWNLRTSRGGPVRLVHDEGEELVWSPDSKYLLYNARRIEDIMGTGTDYMIVRISDGATMRRSWTTYVPTGACWFE